MSRQDGPARPGSASGTIPESNPNGKALTAASPSATSFGPRYQVGGELARGAMGRVFTARDLVLDREIAIKEPLDPASASARSRFEREARITSRLEHPGIISIHELARRPEGAPYLVMRLVHGQRLDEVLAGARSIEERLALLVAITDVADAVAYAHANGVIHRDLKPGNVLLGEHGDTVVIDWGLAKDLRAAGPEESLEGSAGRASPEITFAGTLLGTPVYMAPEQALGESADERSDVYALGAILYHVLCGEVPYRAIDARAVLDQIRIGPPVPLRQRAPQIAEELSAIVERAMARDPAQRYRNAGELAAELRRFQTGRLVLAHDYTSLELVRRWARRNAPFLVPSAIFLVLLAAGGALAVRRVLAERDRANREAESSRRVSSFVTGMFTLADPSEARGTRITAREILDKAAAEIEAQRDLDNDVRSRLMGTMGKVYMGLGLTARAEPLLGRTYESLRASRGASRVETLAAAARLGRAWTLLDRAADAGALLGNSLAEARARLGNDHPVTLELMQALADNLTLQGNYGDAEKLLRELIAISRPARGDDPATTLPAMRALGIVLVEGRGDYPEAVKILEETVDVEARVLGRDHPDTIKTMRYLVWAYLKAGKLDEAERVGRETVELARRVLGPDHFITAVAMSKLASVYQQQQRSAEAEKLFEQAIELERRVLGPDHSETLRTMLNLALVLVDQRRFAEAEKLDLEILERDRRVLGPRHPMIAGVLYNLGCLSALAGDKRKALNYLREAVLHGMTGEIAQTMAKDSDLASLHGDKEFEALLIWAKNGKPGTQY